MENTYKIYYVWVGNKEMPDQCKRYIDTWSKIKNSQIIQIGNECEILCHDSPFLNKAFETENWCNVSNYMRAYAMAHWGGIYMDTDVEVVRDSEVWRSEKIEIAAENKHWLNSHVMIAHKYGHPMFLRMLEKLDSFDFPGEVALELESGPRLITRVYNEMKPDGVTVHQPSVFSPHPWNEKFHPDEIKADTLAIHHFTKLW